MKLNTSLLVTTMILGSVAANAAVIVGTTSISYTGTEAVEPTIGNADWIIDGSGLSAPVTTTNIGTVTHAPFTDGSNSWVTIDPGAGGGSFFAESIESVSFEIIFDGTYNVTDLTTWGYGWNADQGNNVSNLTLDYGVGNYGSQIANLAIGVTTLGDSLTTSLGSTITADRIRITVNDNHFGTSGGGDRVGLAELRFTGNVVPEPSSAALLGLGGLALILRRRK